MKNYYYQRIFKSQKLWRAYVALVFFVTATMHSYAQTTLVAGDIAFTGYNSNDGAGGLANEFSFIILRSGGISNGTTIYFTDNGWNNLTSALTTTEGVITWSSSSAVAQFAEIKIKVVAAGNAISAVSSGTATVTTNFILSQGGDQVLAYQGTSVSPTFISGIHMNSEIASSPGEASTASTWDIIGSPNWVITSSRSAIPPGLTNGVNAIMAVTTPGAVSAEKDNGLFNCMFSTATSLSSLRSNLFNVSNWQLQDLIAYTIPSGCMFGIGSPPVITLQPENSIVCSGTSTSFVITATNATSYQWQVDQGGGSGFVNLTNVAPYSGVTTPTLNIAATPAGLNGYNYRCLASGSIIPVAQSNNAKLTVNVAPAVTDQTVPSIICEGASTSFKVVASNATGYQWQVNTGTGFVNVTNVAPYTGATTATLSINPASAALNGYKYRSIVSGACAPTATSNEAALTVNLIPVITLQPKDTIVCTNGNAEFNATASNAVTYEWQADPGTGFVSLTDLPPYSGTKTAKLKITSVTNGLNNYKFKCVITGTCLPTATSNAALLKVNVAPLQPNTIKGVAKVCSGVTEQYVVDSVGSATSYTWSLPAGATGVSVTNKINVILKAPGGVIKVTANNACGSSLAKELNIVVNELPKVTVNNFGEICLSPDPYTLTGGLPLGGTYSGDGVVNNIFTPSVAGEGNTTITYTYSDANSCIGKDSAIIKVIKCNSGISKSKPDAINVYPNPFGNSISIQSTFYNERMYMDLYNMLGEKVMHERITSVANEFITSQLQKGIYFIHIVTPAETITKKVVKQ